MFLLWALVAVFCVLAGLAGCVLPVLPGPPLSWVGLFVVWAARGFEPHTFGTTAALVLLGVTLAVTALDVLAPVIGAKRYGATKWGTWGSVAGMIAGAFLVPPFGMILGTFLGALAGEMVRGRPARQASRAAWGTFVGTMLGMAAKLAVSAVIAWYVVREVFA